MSYDTTTPGANDRIDQTQPLIQGNFAALKTYLDRNHIAISDPSGNANEGKHINVEMPDVTTPGAQTDPASVVYTKKGTGGVYTNYSLPFFRNQSGELPMLPDLSNTSTNYSFQMGNLIFNLGRGEIASGAQTINVTWKTAFPTATLMILCSKDGNGLGSSGNTLTINGKANGLSGGIFTAQTTLSSGNMPFYYLAIGY